MAVRLLRPPVPVAFLRDQRLPLLAACQTDRRQGEGQEEEVEERGKHCQGNGTTTESRLD